MDTHHLVRIEVLPDYKLHLFFSDGADGIFEAKKHLKFQGVYEPLNNPEFFAQARIEPDFRTLTWPGDLDLCPDCIYHWATGTPFPEYVQEHERKKDRELATV